MADSLGGAELRIVHDADAAAVYTTDLIQHALATAVAERGRASIMLAGGSTPRRTYERLEPFAGIEQVDWLLGDERLVEPGSSESNAAMVEEALLDRLSITPRRRCLPALGGTDDEVIADYDRRVRAVLDADREGCFDLAILGTGSDGHTASLFPGDADRHDSGVVVPATAPEPPRRRLTLAANALNRARTVLFLVVGESKAEVLPSLLLPPVDERSPATWIRPSAGRLLWVVDKAAAARLH